ncbi:MAG: DUF928 domain-containing protein [Cyanomargarita calcarea GSE-NOS-MK-12-04C]|jgi:hypothetical protein|uniref:DUF928 domain-containing protein n=1 Tax=Cyanomargarita calcarea GSE-NOS-MK-12-04C TaxID=2839659 RepID=A0A951URJ0_9CYAN|nr:DUF928 domain-containing protein [Cyanomargarita calcarea GSE-NOS-MK-12-04C]
MRSRLQKIQFTLAISWTFFNFQTLAAPPPLQKVGQAGNSFFVAPPPPPDIGEPGQRSQAGSRGCGTDMSKPVTLVSSKQLTALVPIYSGSQLVFGTTIAERPRFFFYVPYSSASTYGEFVLEEAQNQTIYKTLLTETPGVVNISLPSKAAPLEIGKQYRWYFNIYCKKDNQIIGNVEGYVKREQLNSNLKTQLEKATLSQRVTLYRTNGIWYEALNTASELRRTNSQDKSWAGLLQAVGLNDLVNEPKVDCCALENQ